MHAEPVHYVEGLPQPGRCLVMGVLNVTPDSFSDGGRWAHPHQAIARGRRLLRDGADLLDVGGESTRPGAERVDVEEELRRVLPVVRELVQLGAVVSVDTMRARVAEAALDAGAQLVNDVSGGRADDAMLPLVAAAGAAYCCMHWRGHSTQMEGLASYLDVVAEVKTELSARIAAALDAGVAPHRLAIDPGIGFAKSAEHNWDVLGHLEELHELGRPVMVGASRKRFLGSLLGGGAEVPAETDERDAATAAISTLAAAAGAWCVRVHEVAASRDAVAVVSRWAQATVGSPT